MERSPSPPNDGQKLDEDAIPEEQTIRIEPTIWTAKRHAAAVAKVKFGLRVPTTTPAPELLSAILNSDDPDSSAFLDRYHTESLRNIAWAAYQFVSLDPAATIFSSLPFPHGLHGLNSFRRSASAAESDGTPHTMELRNLICVQLIEDVLRYLCTDYGWPSRPLVLNYSEKTDKPISWKTRGFISSRVWVMTPRHRKRDLAEEAAFVLSLAMDFIVPEEKYESEIWVVSVLGGSAVLARATLARPLMEALEKNDVKKAGKPSGPDGFLWITASKEYRLSDETQRVEFVKVLAGLPQARPRDG